MSIGRRRRGVSGSFCETEPLVNRTIAAFIPAIRTRRISTVATGKAGDPIS
jgi:hypothetical protein